MSAPGVLHAYISIPQKSPDTKAQVSSPGGQHFYEELGPRQSPRCFGSPVIVALIPVPPTFLFPRRPFLPGYSHKMFHQDDELQAPISTSIKKYKILL